MDPLFAASVFGAVGLTVMSYGGFSAEELESFGHHLNDAPGFRSLGIHSGWDYYAYSGPTGSFVVAMYAAPNGSYPHPVRTNVEYFYPDGVEATSVRAEGPSGSVWRSLDIPGRRSADLFVYHPSNHPPDFPSSGPQFGAVSAVLGGRGPGAGTGLSPMGGGRQIRVPYAWSGSTSSGGFSRWRSSAELEPDLGVDPEAQSQVDSDEPLAEEFDESDFGSPDVDSDEDFGFFAITRSARIRRAQEKIDIANQKIKDLEDQAVALSPDQEADLERISKQISNLQGAVEKLESKISRLEMKGSK